MNLSEIAADVFSYQKDLKIIDLSGNHLKYIDMNLFMPSFYSLTELYVDENGISELMDELPTNLFLNLDWRNNLRLSRYEYLEPHGSFFCPQLDKDEAVKDERTK